jgi:hypothetical protein
MKRNALKLALFVTSCAVIVLGVALVQQKSLSKNGGGPDAGVKAEDNWDEFKESDFSDEAYGDTVSYISETLGSFDKLVTTLVKNSDLPDTGKVNSDEAFLILGQAEKNFSINSHLNYQEIQDTGHLCWEDYALGKGNAMVFLQGYVLFKNKKIAELELELLKAKKANPKKIADSENKLKAVKKQIQQFAKKNRGWAD